MSRTSIEPLALLAMRQAGADGFAVRELNSHGEPQAPLFAAGVPIPESLEDGSTVIVFPLRVKDSVTGTLSFVFRGKAVSREGRAILERIVGPIETVWRFAQIRNTYAVLATRIGELEAELEDAKIADRARGLLDNAVKPGKGSGAIEIVEGHVENVLRSRQSDKVLEQIAGELEQKVAERRLVSLAKAVLQNVHGMSEEEAHIQLQAISRKTRRPVKEVARELSPY